MENRRDFLKKVAVGATAAVAAPAILSSCQKTNAQVMHTRNNPSLTATDITGEHAELLIKEKGLPITGTFLDEISHDIPHQNWGEAEWDKDFQNMKAFGIDTVITCRCGYRKFVTYPSDRKSTL